MVIQQAMAAGRPVVATTAGGIPDLVQHGEHGLLTDFGNTAALTRCLTEVLRDEALRQRLGMAGRRRAAERFRADAVASQTLRIYRRLLSRPVQEVLDVRPA